MSSPVGHSLAGYLLYYFRVKGGSPKRDILLFSTALFVANFPDLDFLPGFIIGQPNRYHHGISHSFGVALLVSLLAAWGINLLKKQSIAKNFLFFLSVYSSHLLFDFISVDSRPPAGIPVFWPLSSQYMIFVKPILPPIRHSHLDNATSSQLLADVFSMHNLYVIFFEFSIIILIFFIVLRIIRKEKHK